MIGSCLVKRGKNIMRRMTMTEYRPFIDRKHLMQHISALLDEIDFLKEQLQPHDTGHIHTAISVLDNRVEKLLEDLRT